MFCLFCHPEEKMSLDVLLDKFLLRALLWLVHVFVDAFDALSGLLPRTKRDFDLKTLPKTPKHVAFSINDADFDPKDVLRLLKWTLNVQGVEKVSFYDFRGRIRRHFSSSSSSLDMKTPKRFRWHGVENARNGFAVDENVVDVFLLSAENGIGDIVDAANKRARNGVHVDQGAFESLLATSTMKNWSDPDLLVRSGNVASNVGFPPWQIRLTEIYDIPLPLKGIRIEDLYGALDTFGRCEQRFGR